MSWVSMVLYIFTNLIIKNMIYVTINFEKKGNRGDLLSIMTKEHSETFYVFKIYITHRYIVICEYRYFSSKYTSYTIVHAMFYYEHRIIICYLNRCSWLWRISVRNQLIFYITSILYTINIYYLPKKIVT